MSRIPTWFRYDFSSIGSWGYEELMELFDKTETEDSEECKACEG